MRIPLATLLAVALIFAPAALAAEEARSESALYFGSGDYATSTLLDKNLGGARFLLQAGEAEVRLSVHDALAGDRLTLVACQDLNLDGFCGGPAEPFAAGCGAVGLAAGADERSLDPTQEVIVFVQTGARLWPGGCAEAHAPTHGRITAQFY